MRPILTFLALSVASLPALSAAEAGNSKPKIVHVLFDDMLAAVGLAMLRALLQMDGAVTLWPKLTWDAAWDLFVNFGGVASIHSLFLLPLVWFLFLNVSRSWDTAVSLGIVPIYSVCAAVVQNVILAAFDSGGPFEMLLWLNLVHFETVAISLAVLRLAGFPFVGVERASPPPT